MLVCSRGWPPKGPRCGSWLLQHSSEDYCSSVELRALRSDRPKAAGQDEWWGWKDSNLHMHGACMLGAVGLPKKAEGESGWLLPQIYDLLLYQLSYIPRWSGRKESNLHQHACMLGSVGPASEAESESGCAKYSLDGCCSTVELRPHRSSSCHRAGSPLGAPRLYDDATTGLEKIVTGPIFPPHALPRQGSLWLAPPMA